jgi:hypothetical protein
MTTLATRVVSVIPAVILACLLAPPSVSTGSAQPGRLHPHVVIATAGDRLSLTIRDAPWPLVLEEFRKQARITLHVGPAPTRTITASLENARVETALRVLFGGDADIVSLYRPRPGGHDRDARGAPAGTGRSGDHRPAPGDRRDRELRDRAGPHPAAGGVADRDEQVRDVAAGVGP